MSGTRTLVHLLSVAMLLLWGGVMLYFYASGRITHYLPPDGIFRPMVLTCGIGLVVLGLFNLLTMTSEDSGCEGHDHSHDNSPKHPWEVTLGLVSNLTKTAEDSPTKGHDHAHKDCGHDHGHDHDHSHKDGTCGHDHSHDHDHGHKHDHGTCDHDHAHHEGCGHDHAPKEAGCCGHDHGHSQAHSHEGHAHGILDESSWPGRIAVLLILAAPLSYAALATPDRYSSKAVVNKGLYNPNYADQSRAGQFDLKAKVKTAPPTATNPAQAPAVVANVTSAPPAPAGASTQPPPAGVATASAAMLETGEPPKNAPPATQQTKSYGTFSLEDLKQQVPQSKEGNFILEVPELYYTGGDQEVQKVLTGQMVETIAQILPEKVNNEDGHRLRIFRMLVQCCAADARPYSVPVDFGKKAPELKDMTWVKVVGKMSYKKEGEQTVPIIQVTKVEETTAPDNAMIY